MGGTEEQFGLFINYGAKSGSTSLACSTFRQFWPLASELDFKIEQFELWIVDEDPIAYSSEIKLDAKEDKKKIFDLLSENLETSKQTHEVTKTVITEKDNIMLRTEHDISRKVKDSASPTKINNLQQNLTTVTKTGDHLGKETIKETTTKVTTVVHETFQKQRNQDSGEKCRLETGTKQLSGDKSTNHTAKLHKGFIQECNRDLERSPTAEARNVKTLQEGRRSFVHPSEKQDGDIRRSPKLQANKGDFVHPSLKQKQETGIRKCRLETGTKRLSEDKSINHTAKLHKGCIQECKRDLERSPLAEARNVKAAQGGRRSFVHPSEKQDGDIRRSQKPQEADEGGFVHPSLKPKQESSLLINNKNQNARVPPDSSATEGSTVLITNMAQVSSQTIKGAIPKSSKVTEITINNSTVEGSKNYSGSSRTKEITNDITFIKLPLRMNGTSLVEVQVQVGESKLLRPTCRMSNKKHCACAVRHPCNCNVVVKNLSKTVSSGEKSNKLTFKSEYQEKTVIHDFVSNKLPSPPTLSVIAPDSKPERIYSTTKSSDAEYQEKTEIRDIITNKLPSTQTLSIIAPDNKPHTSDFTTNKLPSTQALPVVAQDNKPERIYSSTKSSDVNTTIKSSDVNTTIKSSDVNTTIKSSDVNTTLNSLDVNTTINNTIITEETVESSLPTPPQNVTSPLILESKDILSTVSKDVKDSCPEDGCRCSSSTDTSSDWEGGAISCTLDKLKLKSECSCQCEATLLGDSNITSKCKIDVGSSSLCSCVLGPKDQRVAKSSPEEEPSATEIPSDPSFFSKKETQYLTRSSKKSENSLRYEVNDNLSKSLPSLSSDNNHGFFPSSNKNNTYSSTISSKNSFISSRSAKGVQLSISSRSHHMCSEPLAVERSPLKKSPVPTNETNEHCIFSPTRSCKKTNILLGPGESCQSSNSMSSARISSNKCESRSCSQQAKHFLTTKKMNSYTKCSNTETQCLTQLSNKSETSKTPGSSTQLGLPIPPTCLKCRTMVKTAGCRCETRDTIKNAPIVEQAPKLLQRPGPSGRSSISERNIDTESKSKRKSIEVSNITGDNTEGCSICSCDSTMKSSVDQNKSSQTCRCSDNVDKSGSRCYCKSKTQNNSNNSLKETTITGNSEFQVRPETKNSAKKSCQCSLPKSCFPQFPEDRIHENLGMKDCGCGTHTTTAIRFPTFPDGTEDVSETIDVTYTSVEENTTTTGVVAGTVSSSKVKKGECPCIDEDGTIIILNVSKCNTMQALEKIVQQLDIKYHPVMSQRQPTMRTAGSSNKLKPCNAAEGFDRDALKRFLDSKLLEPLQEQSELKDMPPRE